MIELLSIIGEKLSGSFRKAAAYNEFRYVHFDFHKECSKMRWHRLQILMDRVKSDIEDQSYYLSTADGTVLQRQVRTRPLIPQ